MSTPQIEGAGLTRTDMDCHQCGGSFIAELDFDVNGNHEVECPRCQHIHYRTVENGKITGVRWSSDSSTPKVDSKASTWRGPVRQADGNRIEGARVSTAALFLRDRWLNRSDA